MGAPKAKENTPRHVAEIPKKRSGPSPDSDSGLLQWCVSLQSPPDLTQMGVGAAYSETGIKSNYLRACHRTKLSKILCCKPAHPFPHAAKVISVYYPGHREGTATVLFSKGKHAAGEKILWFENLSVMVSKEEVGAAGENLGVLEALNVNFKGQTSKILGSFGSVSQKV